MTTSCIVLSTINVNSKDISVEATTPDGAKSISEIWTLPGVTEVMAFKKSGSDGLPNTIEPVFAPLQSTSNTKKSWI